MDDLRRLLHQQQREIEQLQRHSDARLATLRTSASSPHLTQLRRLHSTLSRQRRYVEALEVLRTLESLEWREAESQREHVELENEAQLEAMLKRHSSERHLLEQHMLRAAPATGAVDLASSWASHPQPNHRHRKLRAGTSPYLAAALTAEPSQTGALCSGWEEGNGGEQHTAWQACSPRSPTAAGRLYDQQHLDGHAETACVFYQEGMDEWQEAHHPSMDDSGAWSAPGTAAAHVMPQPSPPTRVSHFSISNDVCVASIGKARNAAQNQHEAPAAAATGAASSFDQADWDVFCTLQHAAQQWYQDLPPPRHPTSYPSSPAHRHRAPPQPPAGWRGPAGPAPRQPESPLAQRLAQLKGLSTPPTDAREGVPVHRPAPSTAVQSNAPAACSRQPILLPSIHSPPAHHQAARQQRPWSSGSQNRRASGGGYSAGSSTQRGSRTAPPASGPRCAMPSASGTPQCAWDAQGDLLPQLLNLLLSARTPMQTFQRPVPCSDVGPGDQQQQGRACMGGAAEASLAAAEPHCTEQPQAHAMQLRLASLTGSELPGATCSADSWQAKGSSATEAGAQMEGAAQPILPSPPPPHPTAGSAACQQLHPAQNAQLQQPVPPQAVAVPRPAADAIQGLEAALAIPSSSGPAGDHGGHEHAGVFLLEGSHSLGHGQADACSPAVLESGAGSQQAHPTRDAGCSPAAAFQEAALLHDHCRHGRYEEARELMKGAAIPVDVRDPGGNTPLMLACAGGHGRLVKMCLRKGADMDAQNAAGETALHLAAAAGHKAVVKHLLQSGANPSLRSKGGASAEEVIVNWNGHTRSA